MSGPGLRGSASQRTMPHMVARFLALRVSAGLLNHLDFLVGEAIKLVDEGVDLAVGF